MLAAVDGNWMLHRIWHTRPEHSSPDQVGRSLAYRLLALVCKDLVATKCKKVIVAFDGAHVFRHDIADKYKANRGEEDGVEGGVKEDSPYTYLPMVCAYFAEAGIATIQMDKYEADDVLRSVAAQNDNVVLLAKDKDSYQSLRPGVVMYDSSFKVKGLPAPRTIRHTDVEGLFGVKPSLCADYQTLVGDRIDNVEPLLATVSLTRKQVVAALNEHGSLKAWLKADRGVATKLRPHKRQLELNNKLVRLVKDLEVVIPTPRWSSDPTLPRSYFAWKDFCNPKTKSLFG